MERAMRILTGPGFGDIVLLVCGALVILCIVALFLRWFLRLDEIAKTLHGIHDELKLLRHAREGEGSDELSKEEEEEYHL